MKKKIITVISIFVVAIGALSACGNAAQNNKETTEQVVIETSAEETETTKQEETTAKAIEEETKNPEEEANACYEAGRAFLYGLDGQAIDHQAAYDKFEQALEKGKTEANFYLGALYDWYSYPELDYEKARTYYEAAGDNPYAQIALGFLYMNGQGVEEDSAKGQELIDAAIAAGYVEGYSEKADAAEWEGDYTAALDYYQKAAEGQEPLYVSISANQIGYFYDEGLGVEQDYAKAMEWYQKAADFGYAPSMNNIGYIYENGHGVEQDYAKAMEWYEKAADLGHSSAMNNIGWLYQNGLGVEQDYVKAMEWYGKATDLGNSSAMNNIGYLYENGLGVEQDSAKAQEWYDKAEAAE